MNQKIQKQNPIYHMAQRLCRIFLLVVVLVTLSSFIFIYARRGASTRVEAATSSNLNFQARLLNASGSLVADGTYNIQFNLYSVSSGGSTLWTETYLNNAGQGVTVRNGYMSVQLGALTSFPALNWDQDLWLGMTVRGTGSCAFGSCAPTDAEMSPRIKLTAVPYALSAGGVTSFNGTQSGNLSFSSVTNSPNIILPNIGGTNNVLLQSGTTLFSQGSISFADSSGLLTQDNANFYFDDTNNTLGIGTTRAGAINGTGNARLVVKGAGATSATSSLNVANSSDVSLLYVRDDGNVGVGTTSPSAKLHVIDTARISSTGSPVLTLASSASSGVESVVNFSTGDQSWKLGHRSNDNFFISDVTGGSTVPFEIVKGAPTGSLYINASGNIGIGTTIPGKKLDVNGAIQATTSGLYFSGTQVAHNSTNALWLELGAPHVRLTPSGVTAVGAATPNSFYGLSIKGGSTASVFIEPNAAGLAGAIIRGATSQTGDLLQFQNNLGTAITVVDSAGSVGIGATAPRQQLSVGSYLDLYSGNINSPSQPSIRGTSSGNLVVNSTNALYLNLDSGTAGVYFGNGAGGTTGIIQASGSVGIGTTAPSSNLHVNGTEAGAGTNLVTSRITHASSNSGGSNIFRVVDGGGSSDLETNSLNTGPYRYGTYADTNIVNNYVAAAGAYGNINLVTNGATALTVTGGNAAGKVGIGTTAPLAKLQVNDTNRFSGTSTVSSALTLGNATFVTTDAQAADVGAILALGGDRGSSGAGVFGGIRGAKENSTDGNNSGYLGFYTTQSGVAFAERMRISSTGNVGIGTPGPGYKLDVQGGDINIGGQDLLLGGVVRLSDSVSASYTWLDPQSGTLALLGGDNLSVYSGANNKTIRLKHDGTAGILETVNTGGGNTPLYFNTAGATRLTIDTVGHVGIGTTAASSPLQVTKSTAHTIPTVDITHNATNPTCAGCVNQGLQISVLNSLGTSQTNLGLRVDVGNATTNYAGIFMGGNVGIGTATPSSLFSVGSSSQFQVNSGGAIAAATGITSSGTINFSGLTASSAIFTDASKNLTSTAASSALATSLTDETGTGVAVFGTSPAITTSLTTPSSSFDLLNTTATTVNFAGAATTLNIGAAGGTTITPGGNLTLAEGSTKGLTITSDLSAGARSTYPLIVSQANNGGNDSSTGLLRLTNSDTGSTTALLNIDNVSGGAGISFTGLTTGTSITVANVSGNALDASSVATGNAVVATGLTGGSGLSVGFLNGATTASAVSMTGSNGNVTADYTGSIINIAPTRTLSTSATRNESGNYLKLARSSSVTNSGATYNITGDLAALSSNCTQTSGSCTDSAKILSLTQSYANATGNVLTISNAGTGKDISGTGNTWNISKAGAIVGVGVDSGTGLLQGTGGLTLTGTTSLNTSGVATTNIGNSTGTLQLSSNTFNLSIAGAITGATGITSSGTINFSGLTASSAIFTDASKNLTSTAASSALATSLTDETGTGVAVFGTSPAITTSLTTPSSSFDLLNTTATTVNFAGAATTLNIGPGSTSATSINLAGGSAATGCTADGATGDFTCTGAVTGSNTSGTNTGDVTLAAIGSTPNANGATLTEQVLNLQPADASFGGVVTTGIQTFAGAKTFNSGLTIAASSGTGLSFNNTGLGTDISLQNGETIDNDLDNTINFGFGAANGVLNLTSATGSSITNSAGDLTIDPTGNLVVRGSTSATGTAALNVQNSGSSSLLYVRNDGNVGIGTTTPGYKLDVRGDTQFGANSWLRILDTGGGNGRITSTTGLAFDNTTTYFRNAAGSSEWVRITGSGNVGIGTTAPSNLLEVKINSASATNNTLRLSNTAGQTAGTGMVFYNDINPVGSSLFNSGRIYSVFDGASYSTGRLTLQSPTGADTWTDVLSIKNGSVGIGTTGPAAKLHVSGGNIIVDSTFFVGLNGNNNLSYTGGIGTLKAASNMILNYDFIDDGVGAFTLQSGPDTILTALNGGNVGIGTTLPLSKLDVNGGLAVGTYAGANAAPANGLIVSGNVGIGMSSPTYNLDITGQQRIAASYGLSAGSATALLYVPFTHASSNTSGVAQLSGIQIVPTNNSAGSGGIQVTYGLLINPLAGTAGVGTQENYGIRVENQGQASTELSYGLFVDTQSGSTSSYAAAFQGGNVGIGDTTPAAKLDIAGDVAFRLAADYTATGIQNNVNLGNHSSVRYNGAGTATFTGITGGVDGKLLYIHNVSASNLTFANDSASSTAANRIITGTGVNFTLTGGSTTSMQYDATAQRWRIVTGTGPTEAQNLQATYDADSGSDDAVIQLDDTGSIIFRNLSGSTNTSAQLLQADNQATGSTIANFKNVNVTSAGSFNTTAAALTNYGGYFNNTSTRSAGANALTNIGLYASASGAQNNYAAIFENGNVGIGTTSPNTAKLVIQGVTSDNTAAALNIINSGGSTSLMYVRNDGKIGIGTASPDERLHVTGGNLLVGDIAGAGSDPVVMNNVSSGSTTGSNVTSLTYSHTVNSGNNKLLLVGVRTRQESGVTVTGITYGGAALTQLDSYTSADTCSNCPRIEWWYRLNPSVGAANVVVSTSNTTHISSGATTFDNVDQSTPFSAVTKNRSEGITISTDHSSAEGEVVIDILGSDSSSITHTAGSGQTVQWDREDGGRGSSSTADGTALVNMAWTLGSSRDWAHMVVSIKPFVNAPKPLFFDYAAGRLGIGTVTPSNTLDVNGQVRVRSLASSTSTHICRNTSGVLAVCSSNAALKDNIADLAIGGLDTINQLQARQFNWKDGGAADLGFIAEEVAAINPLLGQYEADGTLSGVKYTQLTALLTQGIQELDVKTNQNQNDLIGQQSVISSLNVSLTDTQNSLSIIQNQLNNGQFSSLNISGHSTLSTLKVNGVATIQSLVVKTDARVEGNLEVVGDLTVRGNLKIEGGITTAIGTATTDYTITGLDSIITADAAIEAFEATLPSAAGIAGRQYTIKKTDATSNLVKLMTVDDQTIDGAEHYDLATPYKYITVVSDGSNWIVIGQN